MILPLAALPHLARLVLPLALPRLVLPVARLVLPLALLRLVLPLALPIALHLLLPLGRLVLKRLVLN